MKRLGICAKCGKETTIRDHHYKGYGTDETMPYCLSCDRKAHNKARKEGRCTIPANRTTQLSKNSYRRRWQHIFRFTEILSPNINLHEEININLSTNNLSFWSGFIGNNECKLKEIKEN